MCYANVEIGNYQTHENHYFIKLLYAKSNKDSNSIVDIFVTKFEYNLFELIF